MKNKKQNNAEVVTLLNQLLANEYALFTKTLNYHWNITGPQFHDLHKFLDSQYHELLEVVDNVAERIRTLGKKVPATLKEFSQSTYLKEDTSSITRAPQMISNLLKDHESIVFDLKKNLEKCEKTYHDAGTTDFLTVLMEKHEKMAWMLRSQKS